MNNVISNALTQETPGKVMALLGTALFSLAFMFAVASTDASFSGTSYAINDPLSMENVVAMLDTASASYSQFLAQNLVQPASQTYQLYADNVGWVSENSGVSYVLGLNDTTQPEISYGQVAGATTYKYQPAQEKGGLMDALYSILIK